MNLTVNINQKIKSIIQDVGEYLSSVRFVVNYGNIPAFMMQPQPRGEKER